MTTTAALIASVPLLIAGFHTTSTTTGTAVLVETIDEPERLKVGDTFPAFTIQTPFNPSGDETFDLQKSLEQGPVVVTFYRGSWCPYCRDELSDFQDHIEEFNELGATVIAISPEVDEKSVELAEELGTEFIIAHDEDNKLADTLGLMFKLDGKTIKRYREYGIHVGDSNGTGSWELPVPATYVIDSDGVVQYVFDDEDYRKRAKAKAILEIVERVANAD
jgi:peroxiredoxin